MYLLFFYNVGFNFFNYSDIKSVAYNISIISRTHYIKIYHSCENNTFNNNNIKISNIF